MSDLKFKRGGSFLVEDLDVAGVYVPEELSPEHRAFAKTVRDFVAQEIHPNRDRLEHKDYDLACEKLK